MAQSPENDAVLIVFAFTMGGSLYFYTFTTYMQKYLVNTTHMDASIVSVIMTAVLIRRSLRTCIGRRTRKGPRCRVRRV